MITERAKASFDRLLASSLKSGMPVAGASVSVEPVATLDKIKEKKVVILTVSSYLFRAIAIIYFKPDAATRAYFNRNADEGAPALTDAEFYDRVAECGNVCCGSLNRELGAFFPHVGMSTPNIIDKDCMKYVDLLGCGVVNHYRVVLGGDLTLYASLCVADYGLVDFHVDPAVDMTVDSGELEMF
ncbi:MAG: hypothetical protein M3O01_15890 [Pseudomonadota bacterium]|nr:hypothetical protein [Pseudomonadota bacterium]